MENEGNVKVPDKQIEPVKVNTGEEKVKDEGKVKEKLNDKPVKERQLEDKAMDQHISMIEVELRARSAWKKNWGPGTDWWCAYERWIGSGMLRAMRKPSHRAIEWYNHDRHCKEVTSMFCPKCKKVPCKCEMVETACCGNFRTRNEFEKFNCSRRMKKETCQISRWPETTAGKVGYLAKNPFCALEIYGNKYRALPPLPNGQKKISVTNNYFF